MHVMFALYILGTQVDSLTKDLDLEHKVLDVELIQEFIVKNELF